MPSKLFATCTFLLALVINPAYLGCAADEDETSFGEAEMLESLAAVNEAGSWRFSSDGARYELELSLTQSVGEDELAAGSAPALLASSAHACGSRTFMQSASACVTTSTLVVEGELSLWRVEDDDTRTVLLDGKPVQGALIAFGETLDQVMLDVSQGSSQLVLESSDARAFAVQSFRADSVGTEGVDIDYFL